MEHERKNERNRSKLSLIVLKHVCVGKRDRIPNYRGIFQLGPD
jgi:hypothetical protein